MEREFFIRKCGGRLKLERKCRFGLDIRKKSFAWGGEALELVAQRSYGCLIARAVQDQCRWGPEQRDLVAGVPAHGR